MGGSRRRLKKTLPKVKVGILKRKKSEKSRVPTEISQHRTDVEERLAIRPDWQTEETPAENYQKNRLLRNPNEGFGRNLAPQPLQEKQDGETFSDDDELRALTNLPRKSGKAKPKRLTAHQQQIVGQLIAAHGSDVSAMMRNRKLNKMQHSEGVLKTLLESYQFWEPNSKHDFRAPIKPPKRLP